MSERSDTPMANAATDECCAHGIPMEYECFECEHEHWASVAKKLHDAYERLAPDFGYKTRSDTKEFSPESANGKLMIAACKEVFRDWLVR